MHTPKPLVESLDSPTSRVSEAHIADFVYTLVTNSKGLGQPTIGEVSGISRIKKMAGIVRPVSSTWPTTWINYTPLSHTLQLSLEFPRPPGFMPFSIWISESISFPTRLSPLTSKHSPRMGTTKLQSLLSFVRPTPATPMEVLPLKRSLLRLPEVPYSDFVRTTRWNHLGPTVNVCLLNITATTHTSSRILTSRSRSPAAFNAVYSLMHTMIMQTALIACHSQSKR